MGDYLYLVHHAFNLKIHSFVLMSNHFHLMVTAPEDNLSQAMLYFMRETSREITRLSGRINQTYGARHHKTYLGNYHYFMNTYKYVYRNPVKAGICECVEEYPYSTLSGLCGLNHMIVPLELDTLAFSPSFSEENLGWLNRKPDELLEEEMRLALRHPEFKLRACPKTEKPSRLETELL